VKLISSVENFLDDYLTSNGNGDVALYAQCPELSEAFAGSNTIILLFLINSLKST
jgi:hypothetical protein